jgi:hypothetical protein
MQASLWCIAETSRFPYFEPWIRLAGYVGSPLSIHVVPQRLKHSFKYRNVLDLAKSMQRKTQANN